MKGASIEDQVRDVVAAMLDLYEDELPPDASQDNIAEWTSLRHMAILARLEERFQVSFSLEDMFATTSVLSIVHVLERELEGR